MINTVFIIGAGASKAAGAPLMANFFEVSRDLQRHSPTAKGVAAFDLVFEARSELIRSAAHVPVDLDNLESVFVAFEIASLCSIDLRPASASNLVGAMREMITVTLDECLEYTRTDGYLEAHHTYKSLASIIHKMCNGQQDERLRHRVSVITFNYDTQLDIALKRQGLGVGYYLDQRDTSPTSLLKLHGSLNWIRCKACQRLAHKLIEDDLSRLVHSKGYPSDNGPTKLRYHREIAKLEAPCPTEGCSGTKWEPAIVPPTWSKGHHYEQFEAVWKQAARVLSDADNVVVMGYSLPETDQFFRYLLSLGLLHNSHIERFIVFDPDNSEGFRNKFRNLCGPRLRSKLKGCNVKFEQAIEILRDARSLTDRSYAWQLPSGSTTWGG